ncbi:unnamed protein product [Prorocentrum cordatum]|uniref:SH3 domain-containing protein n=1 Tax=Prorocentrum cordatum TaxID=2364126 RepID=A0ABN9RRU8_9DINO|nr:unnamed protein product [Polarella glacialis]
MGSGASGAGGSKYQAPPGDAGSPSGEPWARSLFLRSRSVESPAAEAPAAARRSRKAEDVARAQKWSRAEVEALSVPQLIQWLEALGTDLTAVCDKDRVLARLWQEIQRQRPPELASYDQPEHVLDWPLVEALRWLEHLGGLDPTVCAKDQLVAVVLERGEELPPPDVLHERAEEAFVTQVTQKVATVRHAAVTLLSHLSAEMQEEAALERMKHPWCPNGRVAVAFQSAAHNVAAGAEGSTFVDVAVGDHVDVTFHEASGWAWCMLDGGARQGWVPCSCVMEIARAIEDHVPQGGEEDGSMALQSGQELQVVLRHYSGWTLVKTRDEATGEAGAQGTDVEFKGHEGWVPDCLLTEHPRNVSNKQQHLVLSALMRLAQEAVGIERSFQQLVAEASGEPQDREVHEAKLSDLYQQVEALLKEYRGIYSLATAQVESAAVAKAERMEKKGGALAIKDPEGATQSGEGKGAASVLAKAKPPRELPGWVYLDSQCVWKSKSQGKTMPVTIKKICEERRQVIVVFNADGKSRKVVSFDDLKDPDACPLQPAEQRTRSEQKRLRRAARAERRARKKQAALEADARNEHELKKGLRGMIAELGAVPEVDGLSSESSSSARSSSSASSESVEDITEVYEQKSMLSLVGSPASKQGPASPAPSSPAPAPKEGPATPRGFGSPSPPEAQMAPRGPPRPPAGPVQPQEQPPLMPSPCFGDGRGGEPASARGSARGAGGKSAGDATESLAYSDSARTGQTSLAGAGEAAIAVDAAASESASADVAADSRGPESGDVAQHPGPAVGALAEPEPGEAEAVAARVEAAAALAEPEPGTAAAALAEPEPGTEGDVEAAAAPVEAAAALAEPEPGTEGEVEAVAAPVEAAAALAEPEPGTEGEVEAAAAPVEAAPALAEPEPGTEGEVEAVAAPVEAAAALAEPEPGTDTDGKVEAVAAPVDAAAALAEPEPGTEGEGEAVAAPVEAGPSSTATELAAGAAARAAPVLAERELATEGEPVIPPSPMAELVAMADEAAQSESILAERDLATEGAAADVVEPPALVELVPLPEAAVAEPASEERQQTRESCYSDAAFEEDEATTEDEADDAAERPESGSGSSGKCAEEGAAPEEAPPERPSSPAPAPEEAAPRADASPGDAAGEGAPPALGGDGRRESGASSCSCASAHVEELEEARGDAADPERRRREAAVVLQAGWRGRVGRRAAPLQRKQCGEDPAADGQKVSTRETAPALEVVHIPSEMAAQHRAAARVQGLCRMRRSKQQAGELRRAQRVRAEQAERERAKAAAGLLQRAVRGWQGRRRALGLRAAKLQQQLAALVGGEGLDLAAEGGPRQQDAGWLEGALRIASDAAAAHEKLGVRLRRAPAARGAAPEAAGAARSSSSWAVGPRAVAAGRLALAARAAQERSAARSRALLQVQVAGALAPVSAAAVRAMAVDEGLLGRLAVEGAVSEAAEVAGAAWITAAVCRSVGDGGGLPAGVPPPQEAARAAMTAASRRLRIELACWREDASRAGKGTAEADAEAKKALGKRVAKAEKEAESRAYAARHAVVQALQSQLDTARAQCRGELEAVEAILQKLPGEKKALLKKRTSEAEAEEKELRQRRQEKYAQTVGLHKFAIETQIEKERLEGTLYSSDPKLSVLTHVQARVHELAEELQVLEVDGVNNRKSQGILMHTLRALEGRAAKAVSLHVDKTQMPEKRDSDKDDYVPSDTIRKKQERQAEQEVQFVEALETEVKNLRADLRLKAEAEVAALGVARRDEAESHREALEEASRALAEARAWADGSRRWLGAVVPLARASARASEVAAYLRDCPAEGHELRARLKTAVVRLEDARDFLSAVNPADSPRDAGFDQVACRIKQAFASLETCRAENPDPQKPKRRKKRVPSKEVDAVATDASVEGQRSQPLPPPPALEPEGLPAGAGAGAGAAAARQRPKSAVSVRPPASKPRPAVREEAAPLPPAPAEAQAEPQADGQKRHISKSSKMIQGLADLGGELAALESALGDGTRRAARAPVPPRPAAPAAGARRAPPKRGAAAGDTAVRRTASTPETPPPPVRGEGDGVRKASSVRGAPSHLGAEVTRVPSGKRGAAAPRGAASPKGAERPKAAVS